MKGSVSARASLKKQLVVCPPSVMPTGYIYGDKEAHEHVSLSNS